MKKYTEISKQIESYAQKVYEKTEDKEKANKIFNEKLAENEITIEEYLKARGYYLSEGRIKTEKGSFERFSNAGGVYNWPPLVALWDEDYKGPKTICVKDNKKIDFWPDDKPLLAGPPAKKPLDKSTKLMFNQKFPSKKYQANYDKIFNKKLNLK